MSDSTRRLAAIMFTDMVGYTALGQRNESLALALVEEQRKLIRPILARHDGREVKTIGDAFLVEFPSALEAVRCSYDIQRATRELNFSLPEERRVHLRIGVHLGDVVESKGDISGDAVNVASRVEPLADDGGVCLTRQVYDHVQNKFGIPMTSLGPKSLKNVSSTVEVFKMIMPWDKEEPSAYAQPEASRIAVLPFANMSPDPNDSYFADGITEEIISTVSGISGFSVISRTSVMGYKGTSKRLKEIGRELEVGSVLEGSFRKAGNKIRITTQLIDVAGDKHLWAQNYDRELDDVFAIQSDIAKQVANALQVRILPHEERIIEKTPTKSSEAHELYLRGRFHWSQRNKQSLLKAIDLYEDAIKLDPDFALAYSGISDAYSVLANHGLMSYAEAHPKVKEYALKAVEKNDASAEAHASLASALYTSDRDYAASEKEFKRAIELSPSYATAHQWYGIYLLYTARLEAALVEAHRAEELDPLSPQIVVFAGIVQGYLGRYDKALEQYSKALELHPEHRAAIANQWGTYLQMGRFEDAERAAATYLSIFDEDILGYKIWLAATYAMEGKVAEARRMMEEADAMPNPGHLAESGRVVYHAALGDVSKAVELIEGEDQRGADWLGSIAYDPLYAAIREDPRVISILRKVGALT